MPSPVRASVGQLVNCIPANVSSGPIKPSAAQPVPTSAAEFGAINRPNKCWAKG